MAISRQARGSQAHAKSQVGVAGAGSIGVVGPLSGRSRFRYTRTTTTLLAVVLSVPFSMAFEQTSWAAPKVAQPNTLTDKVAICHATGSGKYDLITPSKSADVGGHASHDDDVIPAFDYLDNGVIQHFGGLNAGPVGEALLARGCKPEPVVTVPPIVTPPPNVTPPLNEAPPLDGTPPLNDAVPPVTLPPSDPNAMPPAQPPAAPPGDSQVDEQIPVSPSVTPEIPTAGVVSPVSSPADGQTNATADQAAVLATSGVPVLPVVATVDPPAGPSDGPFANSLGVTAPAILSVAAVPPPVPVVPAALTLGGALPMGTTPLTAPLVSSSIVDPLLPTSGGASPVLAAPFSTSAVAVPAGILTELPAATGVVNPRVGTTSALGIAEPASRAATAADRRPTALPFTGAPTTGLLELSLVLLAGGAGALLAGRRRIG